MRVLFILLLFIVLSFAKENLNSHSHYYTVSWRDIFCIREPCDRYTFAKLNSNESRKSAFDLQLPSTLKHIKKYILEKESNSIIVYGHLIPSDKYQNETNDFNVVRVYKQLPLGDDVKSTDRFYYFTDIENNKNSILINSYSDIQSIRSVHEPYTAKIGAFDDTWLNSKLYKSDDDALIGQGTINEYGDVILSNAYIHLPDSSHKCKKQPQIKCEEGYMVIYNRDENRCHYFNQTCILTPPPDSCTFIPPECDEGYKLDVWSGARGGCNLAFRCDAYFLPKTK